LNGSFGRLDRPLWIRTRTVERVYLGAVIAIGISVQDDGQVRRWAQIGRSFNCKEPIMESAHVAQRRESWNKGKLGQKAPLKLKNIWAIQVRLQLFDRLRDLALFDLAVDSKLRACDLVRLRVRDAAKSGGRLPCTTEDSIAAF
jgi:hypothetical protein